MVNVKFYWAKTNENGVVEKGTHDVTAPTYADCLEVGFDELTVERKTIEKHHEI